MSEAPTPRLPEYAFRLLKNGDTANRFGGDPFRIVASIITSAANVDFPLDYLVAMLTDKTNPGGAFLRTQGRARARATVERLYVKAQGNKLLDASDTRMKLRALVGLVNSSKLSNGAKRALLAHLRVAMQAGSFTYSRSTRNLSDLSGISRRTVEKWTSWLVNEGYLAKEGGKGLQATTYTLRPNILGNLAPIETSLKGVGVGESSPTFGISLIDHPLFSYGSGFNLFIYQALDHEVELTVADLANIACKSRDTVRAGLKVLSDHGLAIRVDNRLWLSSGTLSDLDDLARARGLVAKQEAKSARHKAETEDFKRRYDFYTSKAARARRYVTLDMTYGETQTTWIQLDTRTGEVTTEYFAGGIISMAKLVSCSA